MRPFYTALRWLPFLVVLILAATLADGWRNAFVRAYGSGAWDNLHWYISAALVMTSFWAQPRRRSIWLRLLLAATITIVIGLGREVLQKVTFEATGSRHDMRSNAGGIVIGSSICLAWEVGRRLLIRLFRRRHE